MKALVVMPATIEALELCDSLTAQGFDVSHAPSGLYALTLLERERPDLIVSNADILDMSGLDLLEIANEEVGAELAFILISDEIIPDLPQNAIIVPIGTHVTDLLVRSGIIDTENVMVVPSEIPELHLLDAAYDPKIESAQEILELHHEFETLAPLVPIVQTPNTLLSNNTNNSTPMHHGDFKFENQGFIHLVRWLSRVTEYAQVDLKCGPLNGQMYFIQGELKHAEFGRQIGEDAIRSLFLAASDHRGGTFSLQTLDATATSTIPNTISRPVTQIVLTWSA